jgi:hypothetical protein
MLQRLMDLNTANEPLDITKAPVSADGSYTGTTLTGWALWRQRFKSVLIKRLKNVSRDGKAFVSQIILPAVFICIGMAVATAFPPPGSENPLVLSPSLFVQPCSGNSVQGVTPFSSNLTTGRYYPTYDSYSNNGFNAEEDKQPATFAAGLAQGLVGGADAAFPFLNLSGDTEFLAADSNLTTYLLNTYTQLSNTRRAAISFEEPENPVVEYSAVLQAEQREWELDFGRGGQG